MTAEAFCAAVDWGTSRIRLWLLSRDGTVLAESRGDEGMLHCLQTGFQPALEMHLATVGADASIPVMICGMAGARRAWREAPYLDTPAALSRLPGAAVRIEDAGRDVRIIPGVAQRRVNAPNVMRGEETQLLGVAKVDESALFCMPGTHCKWVGVENGAIVQFSTFMTGELFDVISKHSILAQSVEGGGFDSSHPAFERAMRRGIASPASAHSALFELRAAQLLGYEGVRDGAPFLSGLLIGAEVGSARALYRSQRVHLVASGLVAAIYRTALEVAGAEVALLDAEEAARDGLFAAAGAVWP
jgi:2-dehydro-3-deoxygalactonokinase